MSTDPQQEVAPEQPKRSGRRAAAPSDSHEPRRPPSGRRALVVERTVSDSQGASEFHDGEPEIAPTRRSIRRSLDVEKALAEAHPPKVVELPEADLPAETVEAEPETKAVEVIPEQPEISAEDEVVAEPHEDDEDDADDEAPVKKKAGRIGYHPAEFGVLAFGAIAAVALFVTLSFVPNGDFTPSVGGGIGALLILLVSFIFSKMVAKRSRKVTPEDDDEDEADELTPHEDDAEQVEASQDDEGQHEEVTHTEPKEVEPEYAPELQRSDK